MTHWGQIFSNVCLLMTLLLLWWRFHAQKHQSATLLQTAANYRIDLDCAEGCTLVNPPVVKRDRDLRCLTAESKLLAFCLFLLLSACAGQTPLCPFAGLQHVHCGAGKWSRVCSRSHAHMSLAWKLLIVSEESSLTAKFAKVNHRGNHHANYL